MAHSKSKDQSKLDNQLDPTDTKVEDKLKEISHSLADPFHKFQEKGNLNAASIFKILQSNSIYKISRFKIIGSKGMASYEERFSEPDFDLVIFVSEQAPPFRKVMDDFEKQLTIHGSDHNVTFESRTSYSTQLSMRDVSETKKIAYVTLDLIPAMNLLNLEEEESDLSQDKMEAIQTDQVLRWISDLRNPRRDILLYSSSLSERYVSFIETEKCKSLFVQDVLRLAKCWNRKIRWHGDKKLEWRSMIVDILALSSALLEEMNSEIEERSPSISEAFQSFLKKWTGFERLFEIIKCPANSNVTIHYEKYLQETCALGMPVIMDPANPYNNLAVNVTSQMKTAFKCHACTTLDAMKSYPRHSDRRRVFLEDFFGL